MSQTVNGNDRNMASLTISTQNIIYSRVVDFLFHKKRLFLRQAFDKFRKADNRLPINLNLTNRGFVFVG